jgi:predicted nucleic-acid-binding protein
MAVIEGDDDLLITDVALAEAAFTATKLYELPRDAVVDSLIGLIQRSNVEVFRLPKDMAIEALMLCRPSNRVSFADALIWAAARTESDSVVYTFDRRFPSHGLTVIDPSN